MGNTNIDRETRRALADEGNETALDRLADLADTDGNLEELSELPRPERAPTDRRRPGYDGAGEELNGLLKEPLDGHRD